MDSPLFSSAAEKSRDTTCYYGASFELTGMQAQIRVLRDIFELCKST